MDRTGQPSGLLVQLCSGLPLTLRFSPGMDGAGAGRPGVQVFVQLLPGTSRAVLALVSRSWNEPFCGFDGFWCCFLLCSRISAFKWRRCCFVCPQYQPGSVPGKTEGPPDSFTYDSCLQADGYCLAYMVQTATRLLLAGAAPGQVRLYLSMQFKLCLHPASCRQ